MVRPLAVALVSSLVAACTVGEITGPGAGDDVGDDDVGPDGGEAGPPDFAISMSPPQVATRLGTENRYSVTLASSDFTGPVSLIATGVPEGWSARFEPSAVTLPMNGGVTVQLVVDVPSTAIAENVTLGVDASAAPGLRQASAQLQVANEYLLEIAAGAGEGAHGLPGRIDLALGATLRIRNGDATTLHRIHSDGGPGFPHQEVSMGVGEEYAVTPGDVGQYVFYCHDHGVGTGVTDLVVQ
jgi:hypothetical protein